MKKHIRLLAIIAVFGLLLTACGSAAPDFGNGDTSPPDNNTPADTPPDDNSSGSVDTPPELDDITVELIDADLTATITLGNWPPDTAPEAELALFNSYKDKMAIQYPNVTVIPSYYSYTLSNYIGMALGGTAPTLFQPPFTDPQLLIGQGLVADVTDALREFGLLEKFSPAFINLLGDENGRIFGLPRDGYVLGMHININLFEEAGLMTDDGLPMYPRTLEELAEIGQIIRERTGKAGLVFPASETFGGWLWTNIAWNFGAVDENALIKQDDDGRWVANFTSEPAIAAMEYFRSLQWDYNILNADTTTTDWASAHTLLGTGEAAMNFAADDSVDQPTAGKGLPVDKFALVPFPAGPGGAYALTGGTCYMFAPNTTNDEAIASLGFLRLIGMLPFADDDAIASMRAGAASARDRGVPVLPPIPAWNDEEFIAAQLAVTEEYSNVDWRLFQEFFESFTDGTITLRGEEPVMAQQLYRELTAVIQRMITREDADIFGSLERAQNNFQADMDDMIN
ncbi:MAG: extracellular solute-binding protein [Oscillospiraceae bacterium]|jgi:ABC-type glycerol-3-phosphate transport system substrate-binding protein|nr:extracellular solute-binding protein [Oscillospiraceae bacterium]